MSLSRIERLDLVARSKATVPVISYARIALLIATPLFVLLAVNSTAPFRETALVAALAVVSLLTAIVLWLNWRFKLYVLSLFCFSFAIGNWISTDYTHSHTLFAWVGAHVWGLLFVYYGCGLWMMARRYAIANESSFRTERDQFEKWMDEHNGSTAIEFPSGSFWTGYWTYRILNPGDCWIVAKSKRGLNNLVVFTHSGRRGRRRHGFGVVYNRKIP
jgi:hypothetical protein